MFKKLRSGKKFTFVEILIALPVIMIITMIVANLIILMFQTKEKINADLQRININTVLNLNHGSMLCYYSSIGAEQIGVDSGGDRSFNQKDIWMVNDSNGEGETDFCYILKGTLKKQFGINGSPDETRLLKHFFVIRTQVLNVYTYKIVLAFANDEDKTDSEHIQRWNNRKDGWYDYRDYLLQIYNINYLGHILKNGSNYNSSAGGAIDELIKRIKGSGNLNTISYELFEDSTDKVETSKFGFRFNHLNFNLIDDALIDASDNGFPYNQIMIQASYRNGPYSYRDYYSYKNGD